MSQQEFEQNDQEVMNLVNGAASPESKAVAEEIAQQVGESTPSQKNADSKEADLFAEELHRKWRRNKIIGGYAIVAACILIAAAIVIVMARPELLAWVANAFILSCGIVAALQIERIVRYMRH
jgi:ferric-dicitrate binding protein FerR (iron transport regulator)